ncbi:MAG: prefoldin subunit [Candidatus Micrarchaeia archaeon]
MENQNTNTENQNNLENIVKEYQLIGEQIRAYSIQLQDFQLQKTEAEAAREEVSKANGKVYFTIGGVIVETDKEKAITNLKEKSESLGLKIQMLNKQLTTLKSKEKALNEKLSSFKKQ